MPFISFNKIKSCFIFISTNNITDSKSTDNKQQYALKETLF